MTSALSGGCTFRGERRAYKFIKAEVASGYMKLAQYFE